MTGAKDAGSGEPEPIRYVDKRRIDPDTGWVRSSPARVSGATSGGVTGATASRSGGGRPGPEQAGAEQVSEGTGKSERPGRGDVRDAASAEAPPTDDAAETTETTEADPVEVEADVIDEGVIDDAEPADDASPASADVDPAAAEALADLKRVTAEYANYRRRAERERAAAADSAKVTVVRQFLPVLDDLDRARRHGDLESGPMRALADKLTAVFEGLGLVAFGDEGDPFDPELHEAVQHEGDGSNPVLGVVMRHGYRLGDKLVRTAMVGVVDGPAESAS